MPSTEKRIIYDIGANDGDDVPYYLKKADLVVAVEANPVLCDEIREKYAEEVKAGRLVVVNCVLTAREEKAEVPFYLSKVTPRHSRFPRPTRMELFEKIVLPSRSVRSLFSELGMPYYVKIDVEHYDHVLLRAMLLAGIRPPYVSVEMHHFQVYALLSLLGGYDRFQLVIGNEVAKKFRNWQIQTRAGREIYSFSHHSAGPFGDDLEGEWINSTAMMWRIVFEGTGWKDIHAYRPPDAKEQGPVALWWVKYHCLMFAWGVYRIVQVGIRRTRKLPSKLGQLLDARSRGNAE